MLNYLDFETSDDGDGTTTFDAMAYATADRWPALQAEVVQVLSWCTDEFGPPGPLDRGHDWDMDLQLQSDAGHVLGQGWDGKLRTLVATGITGATAMQLCLTVSGGYDFKDALSAEFIDAT